jgi:hypothetical protein
MSYKDNKYFKKYCNKHKDIKNTLGPLEIFCNNNGIIMEVFGSVTRNDYYHGKSDYDIVFVSDDIDKASDCFENYIETINSTNINSTCQVRYKDIVNYGVNKDVVNIPGIKYNLHIDKCKCDIIMVNKHDFQNKYNQTIILAKDLGFISLFIMYIIKFIYYQLHIMPKAMYSFLKNFVFELFHSRRMHYIKSLIVEEI